MDEVVSTAESVEMVESVSIAIDYIGALEEQMKKIDELQRTPNTIREIAIGTLKNVLTVPDLPHAARRAAENGVGVLENIRDGSISANYGVIFSQMCVLSVSALEAQLKAYFFNEVDREGALDGSSNKLGQIKLTVAEILEAGPNLKGSLGGIIAKKENISFQDLQSIVRTFEEYFGRHLKVTGDLKHSLIFYLECRHVLVHRGGVVDRKFLEATSSLPKTWQRWSLGDSIVIDESDWGRIQRSFTELLTLVCTSSSSQEVTLETVSPSTPNTSPILS